MANYTVIPLPDFAGGDFDLHTVEVPVLNENDDGTSNTKQENRFFRIARNNLLSYTTGLTAFGDKREIKTLFADDFKKGNGFASRESAIEAVKNNFLSLNTIHRVHYSVDVDGKKVKRWLYAAVTRNPDRLAETNPTSQPIKAQISIHKGEGAKALNFDLLVVQRLKQLLKEAFPSKDMTFTINEAKDLSVTVVTQSSRKEELFQAVFQFISTFGMRMAAQGSRFTNMGALVRYE